MQRIKDPTAKIIKSLNLVSGAFNKVMQEIITYAKSQEMVLKEKKQVSRRAKPTKKKAAAPANISKTRKVKPTAKKKNTPAKKAKSIKPKSVKAKVTPAKKSARVPATLAVLDIIKGSDNGATVAILKEKTGFNAKKITNCIYRLKKQGMIKTTGRGIYTSL